MASRSRRTMPSRSPSSSTDGIAMAPSLLLVLLDVLDGVGDLLDLLGILVRDLHPELLFEAHDQLYEVKRVGVQVLDEGSLGSDLVLVNAELLDDELLETLERSAFGHRSPNLLHPMIARRCRARRSRGGGRHLQRRSGREKRRPRSSPRSGSRRRIAFQTGRSGG